ncbi:MAG: hypothetical protein HY072_03400 [Deltaproteobacteria bacterium]|nr:hypothetical protein [Deltaproteobacteria bacterium]
MNITILFSFILLMVFNNAFAMNFTAKLYELNSDQKNLLFQMKREETKVQDNLSVKNTITDLQGKEAVLEELTLVEGKISKYLIHQKQLGDERVLEVKDNKILFRTTNKNGETKMDEEKLVANLVVGPTVLDYLRKNWDVILKGETLAIRYAALDRRETVGFKFFKESDIKCGNQDCVLVKMKPTSFIIAALVDPLLFTFEKTSAKLLELKGRTLAKRNLNGDWKDLDAHIVYEY